MCTATPLTHSQDIAIGDSTGLSNANMFAKGPQDQPGAKCPLQVLMHTISKLWLRRENQLGYGALTTEYSKNIYTEKSYASLCKQLLQHLKLQDTNILPNGVEGNYSRGFLE